MRGRIGLAGVLLAGVLAGAVFSLGSHGVATDIMTVKSGRGVQIGNYRSIVDSIASCISR